MEILSKIIGIIDRSKKKSGEAQKQEFVKSYLAANPELSELIDKATKASKSTGADISDYVILHDLVRRKKPKYILECGTGMSTWIIAHALKMNEQLNKVKGLVVSMESVEEWFTHANGNFPEAYRPWTDIRYSKISYYHYAFVFGSVYEQIPDHPYEMVFVDGPNDDYETPYGKNRVANMDFVRLVSGSDRPIIAITDNRLPTVHAYSLIFGKEKVSFYKNCKLGVVSPVSRKDLILNNVWGPGYKEIISNNMQYLYGLPEFK